MYIVQIIVVTEDVSFVITDIQFNCVSFLGSIDL